MGKEYKHRLRLRSAMIKILRRVGGGVRRGQDEVDEEVEEEEGGERGGGGEGFTRADVAAAGAAACTSC
jgi:hypothetical protein